jgi:predicted nucleic acid-binding protein
MDERIGRKIAKHYAVPVVGSAGVLLNAKQRYAINKHAPHDLGVMRESQRRSAGMFQGRSAS